MQCTCKYMRKEASHDYFYRFLLQNKRITFNKGFKYKWIQVYKSKFGASKNLSKENWDYECVTFRR